MRTHSYQVRIALVVLLSFTMGVATPVLAQTAVAGPQDVTAGDWGDTLFTSYEVHPNITYRRANHVDLKLDLYLPRNRSKPVPVAMFVHGGGWVAGSKEDAVLAFMPYLQMGFAVVNVEYRLAGDSLAPAAVEDCRCALHWIFDSAARYKFDLKRVVVTGTSAGGHLALSTGLLTPEAGFDRGCQEPEPMRWHSVDSSERRVAAIVNWFGITDLTELLTGPNAKGYAVEWFGNLPGREQLARRISPLFMVRKGSPPVITIHGDQDPVVPYSQAERLRDALTKAGVRNELVTIPGGRHGRFPPDQQRRAWAAVRAFLQENGIIE